MPNSSMAQAAGGTNANLTTAGTGAFIPQGNAVAQSSTGPGSRTFGPVDAHGGSRKGKAMAAAAGTGCFLPTA